MTEISWRLREINTAEVTQIAKDLVVSERLASLLVMRGLDTTDKARNFLNVSVEQFHDPFLMTDMARAADRVMSAIEQGELICIYGDYDVDGAVSTTMLCSFFAELGVIVRFYVPNRMTEGYSLNSAAVEKLAKENIKLIITVDNGIMANAEIARANELGVDVVVTDHHQVGEILPPAFAVVNPQRRDCAYPFKGICGAGVAFKLMTAVRQRLRQAGFFAERREPNLGAYLDLLAIATVCDVVPLTDENRYIVKEGLRRLRATKRPGLKALVAVCGLTDGDAITSGDLGFKLGPRINACGRIDDAALGVRLLLEKEEGAAMIAAHELDALNQERRDIEKRLTDDAAKKVETIFDLGAVAGLVLADADWHVGVVGIVASRLVERFHRPVFLLARTEDGLWKGSGRTAAGVSLIAALQECAPYLKKFGGHEAAAGVTVEPENLEKFQAAFDVAVRRQVGPEILRARPVTVDSELNPDEIDWPLMQELSLLEPFGMGNHKPVFISPQLAVRGKRIVGGEHLKLEISTKSGQIDAIAFRLGQHIENIKESIGALYGLEVNRYLFKDRIQLVVKDFLNLPKPR